MWNDSGQLEPSLLPWVVVMGFSLLAAAVDVRVRRIPNLLTGSMLLLGLMWGLYSGGASGLGGSLLGMLVVATPFVVLWLLGGGGAGDAKMMGAIGAWLGMSQGIVVMLAVAICGGVLSLAAALIRRQARTAMKNVMGLIVAWGYALRGAGPAVRPVEAIATPKWLRVPYGLAIFAGVCVAAGWRLAWQG